MRKIFILFLFLPFLGVAQPAEVAAKRIRATEKLQLSNKTLTAIVESITVLSTHAQSPTAKAVYDLTAAMITSVSTNATLSGNGTSGDPLKIAQQSATSGQVLKWNGTTWLPAADNTGTGTVTSVSVTPTQGVTASVATATTTPNISIGLGAITPTSVAASGTVTGSNLSGTNTGNQTLSYSAPNLSLSGGGGSVAIPQGDITGSGGATQLSFFTGTKVISSSSTLVYDNLNKILDFDAPTTIRYNQPQVGTAFFRFRSADASRYWKAFQADANDRLVICPENNDFSILSSNIYFQPTANLLTDGENTLNIGKIGSGSYLSTTAPSITVGRQRTQTSGYFSQVIQNYSGSDNYEFYVPSGNNAMTVFGSSANGLLNLRGSNVGINDGNPQRPLHVAGIARITGTGSSATTITGRDANNDITNVTLGAGLSLSGGTLSSTATGTVGGTGTAGKVAYWSSTNTLTSTANFAFDGTNLAVGTPTAGAGRLRVVGNSTSVSLQVDAGTLPNFGSQIQSTATTASGNSILGLDFTGTTTGSTTNYLHKLENNGTGSTILQLNSASGGGSPFVQYNIVGGSANWTHGVDNADSRKFKIRPNADWSGTTGLTITTGGLVGIANSSPAASLDMDNTTDGIALSSGNTANRPTSGLRWFRYNSSMAGLETRTISSNWHVLNSANSVTLGAGGALGTAPTITVNNGTEMAYTVSLTVGTAPVANAVIFTRTFPSAWSVAPTIVFSAANQVTASEITKFYVDTQTTGQYTIRANGTLSTPQTYKLNVIVRN